MNPENSFAYNVARRYGQRMGLVREESEDCAIEFIEYIVKGVGSLKSLESLNKADPALIQRIALDFVRNYVRTNYRCHRLEIRCSAMLDESNVPLELEALKFGLGVDDELLRNLFWDIILTELELIALPQRNWFLRHHLHGEPIAEIAAIVGKQQSAVAVAIHRVKKKLRENMSARLGLVEDDLRAYLATPS